MLFDSHNHLQKVADIADIEKVILAQKAAGVCGCVVNGTSAADWEMVHDLARKHPHFIRPAYGVHPWEAHTAPYGWESRLRGLLAADSNASIGEIGLDRWVDTPSLEIQEPIFLAQMKIAAEMKRPVTVHCLKAWEPLFTALEKLEARPSKILMHSFGGSIETARRLLKYGAWFSFSGYFLFEKKRKVLEVFRQLPANRILIETDAPDMLSPEKYISHPLSSGKNHPANLPKIAGGFFAEIPDLSSEIIAQNTKDFWT